MPLRGKQPSSQGGVGTAGLWDLWLTRLLGRIREQERGRVEEGARQPRCYLSTFPFLCHVQYIPTASLKNARTVLFLGAPLPPPCFTAAYSQPQDHPNKLQFSALTTPGLSHLSPHLCGSCLCQLPVRAIPPLPLCLPHELRHHTLLALHSCSTHEGTRASWTGPAPPMTMWPLLAQLRDLCPVMWEACGVYSIVLTELTITL